MNVNRLFKIAYLCEHDPLDLKTNSGTQAYMVGALKAAGHDVKLYFPKSAFFRRLKNVLHRLYCLKYKNGSMFYHSRIYSFLLGLYFNCFCQLKGCDFIFVSRGSSLLAGLKSRNLPVVYTSDATFQLLTGYYDRYSDITESQRIEGDGIEKMAIKKADVAFYPSEWAATSACMHYDAQPERVRVIPSGANVDIGVDLDLEQLVSRRTEDEWCRILFIGRDWVVKGGSVVLEAVGVMNARGVKTKLTVIGCNPVLEAVPDWLEVVPYIDKNDSEGNRLLSEYYSASHFFVLPTRNETFGLVFAEACCFGLPIFATDTGGVSTSVVDGVNGYLLPPHALGSDYAERMICLWRDKKKYVMMSRAARQRFIGLLNWNAWAISVAKLLEVAVPERIRCE